MKKLFFLLFIFSAVDMQADDYKYLMFQTSDGQGQAVSTSNLKITVSGGNLIVKNSSTNATFSLANLSKMYFTNTTGISTLNSQNTNVSVTVFTPAGVNMGSYDDVEAAKEKLQPGVYIFKQADKTFKIVLK
jgi:hypothetical protein